MINEITIAVDLAALLPVNIEIRVLSFLVGLALWIHLTCMASFVSEKCPLSMAVLMGVSASAGLGLILGAFAGSIELLFLSYFVGLSGTVAIMLWLWWNGMHVSSFIMHKIKKLHN